MNKLNLFSHIDLLFEKEKKSVTHLTKTLSLIKNTLNSKKKFIQRLEEKNKLLRQNRDETVQKIRIIEQNIIIYKNNMDKVEEAIANITEGSHKVKNEYDSLLNKPMEEILKYGKKESMSDESKLSESALSDISSDEGSSSYDEDSLIFIDVKKRSLMSSIDKIFKNYEEKIKIFQEEKKILLTKKEQIFKKKEVACSRKELLFSIHESYKNEIKKNSGIIKKEWDDLNIISQIFQEMTFRLRRSSLLKEKAKAYFDIGTS